MTTDGSANSSFQERLSRIVQSSRNGPTATTPVDPAPAAAPPAPTPSGTQTPPSPNPQIRTTSTIREPGFPREATAADVDWFAERFARLGANIRRVLRGKDAEITMALLALVSEGHLLLEDVPGLGKTTLARAIAESISGGWTRIQCTPDLLPSDVTGVQVWHPGERRFEYRTGPVFANVVVCDEVNRASPKTQSALLEVMEERQVTVDGQAMAVPRPFVVIATQNPVEMDGTYRLPEAQLDRFLLKMSLGYPDLDAEVDVVLARRGVQPEPVAPVVTLDEVSEMVALTASVHLEEALVRYAVSLVHATRSAAEIRIGASPRGSLALLRAAQSLAAASGRSFVIADDVKQLAIPVLAHRLQLTPDAQLRGRTAEAVVADLLVDLAVPGGVSA